MLLARTADLAWWQLPQAIPRFVGAVGSRAWSASWPLRDRAGRLGRKQHSPRHSRGRALAVAVAALPAALGYKRVLPDQPEPDLRQ